MKNTKAPQIIAIIFLVIALNPSNPYGYYILLRWICCAVFSYLTYQAVENKQSGWAWTLGVTAFLYNPFLRIHLNRELWVLINLITIIISAISIKKLNSKKGEK